MGRSSSRRPSSCLPLLLLHLQGDGEGPADVTRRHRTQGTELARRRSELRDTHFLKHGGRESGLDYPPSALSHDVLTNFPSQRTLSSLSSLLRAAILESAMAFILEASPRDRLMESA